MLVEQLVPQASMDPPNENDGVDFGSSGLEEIGVPNENADLEGSAALVLSVEAAGGGAPKEKVDCGASGLSDGIGVDVPDPNEKVGFGTSSFLGASNYDGQLTSNISHTWLTEKGAGAAAGSVGFANEKPLNPLDPLGAVRSVAAGSTLLVSNETFGTASDRSFESSSAVRFVPKLKIGGPAAGGRGVLVSDRVPKKSGMPFSFGLSGPTPTLEDGLPSPNPDPAAFFPEGSLSFSSIPENKEL